MARTHSHMLPLGTMAPDFDLTDVISEKKLSLTLVKSKYATVIMFICNHCPFVHHLIDQVVIVAKAYQKQGIHFIAINSNDIKQYPADSPKAMKIFAAQHQFSFPYLFDSTQEIARAYDAACTPDFYVFDSELRCVYRGRFDASNPGNDLPINGIDLSDALDKILEQQAVNPDQKPSLGCNIKFSL